MDLRRESEPEARAGPAEPWRLLGRRPASAPRHVRQLPQHLRSLGHRDPVGRPHARRGARHHRRSCQPAVVRSLWNPRPALRGDLGGWHLQRPRPGLPQPTRNRAPQPLDAPELRPAPAALLGARRPDGPLGGLGAGHRGLRPRLHRRPPRVGDRGQPRVFLAANIGGPDRLPTRLRSPARPRRDQRRDVALEPGPPWPESRRPRPRRPRRLRRPDRGAVSDRLWPVGERHAEPWHGPVEHEQGPRLRHEAHLHRSLGDGVARRDRARRWHALFRERQRQHLHQDRRGSGGPVRREPLHGRTVLRHHELVDLPRGRDDRRRPGRVAHSQRRRPRRHFAGINRRWQAARHDLARQQGRHRRRPVQALGGGRSHGRRGLLRKPPDLHHRPRRFRHRRGPRRPVAHGHARHVAPRPVRGLRRLRGRRGLARPAAQRHLLRGGVQPRQLGGRRAALHRRASGGAPNGSRAGTPADRRHRPFE